MTIIKITIWATNHFAFIVAVMVATHTAMAFCPVPIVTGLDTLIDAPAASGEE